MDRTVGVANTHVVCHAGRILALVETSFPTEVTPDLDTVGPYDFDGRLTTAMTAHPKRCATTGELLFFGYSFAPPYLTYHRATAAGELVQSEDIDVRGPTMVHDFNVTAKHVVWMDLPIVFDLELATQGRFPYVWSDDYGARLGVMPRTGGSADVRWFDIEPCYVFHPANAHEDETGVISVDVARYPELWRGAPEGFDRTASLWRWTIDPAAGAVHEKQLDDQAAEFPRIDPRRVGLPHRSQREAEPMPAPDTEEEPDTSAPGRRSSSTTPPAIGSSPTGCGPASPPASPSSSRRRRRAVRTRAGCSATSTTAPRTAASCSCSTPTTGGRRPWRVFRSPAACPSASTAPGSTTTSCSAGHGRRSAGPGPGR